MAESDVDAVAAGEQPAAEQQQFLTQRIYIKDASFESPASPTVFQTAWKPAINVDLNTKTNRIDDNNIEVVLSVTITATQEGETAFLVEVHQAGIFLVSGIEGENLRRLLGTVCPTILFPYAREVISDMSVRGGFPPLVMSPVNFDALYQQHLQKQQGQSADEDTAAAEVTH